MTKISKSPSVNFRLSDEDKKLLKELAELLHVSQVMAFRLTLREVVPALKAAKGKKDKRQLRTQPT
jgi:predicted transcriptional regulator